MFLETFFSRNKADQNILAGKTLTELAVIEELIAQVRAQQVSSENSRGFLISKAEEIASGRGELAAHIIEQIQKRVLVQPDLLQTFSPPEVQLVPARTGSLPVSARRGFTRSALLGVTPPPLRQREENLPGPEIQQIPLLTVVYATSIDVSMIEGAPKFDNTRKLIAALAQIDLTELNNQLKTANFSINQLKIQLRLVLVGSSGSQTVSFDLVQENNPIKSAITAINQFQEICHSVPKVTDDGLSQSADVRAVILADQLITQSQSTATIPLVSSAFAYSCNRSDNNARSKRGKKIKTTDKPTISIAVFNELTPTNMNWLHNEDMYVE